MNQIEQTLYDLIIPMVDDRDQIKVSEVEGKNKNEISLEVVASNTDTARLIGRRGTMANAIRQTMMIAGRDLNKRIMIHFESN